MDAAGERQTVLSLTVMSAFRKTLRLLTLISVANEMFRINKLTNHNFSILFVHISKALNSIDNFVFG